MAKRYFECIKDGNTHVFTGSEPREAAKKAATRFGSEGSRDVLVELREHGRRNADGTFSIHQYKVGYKYVTPKVKTPNWAGSKTKKPLVKAIGVKRVRSIK